MWMRIEFGLIYNECTFYFILKRKREKDLKTKKKQKRKIVNEDM